MNTVSAKSPNFDEPRREKEGFLAMRARLGRQAGLDFAREIALDERDGSQHGQTDA